MADVVEPVNSRLNRLHTHGHRARPEYLVRLLTHDEHQVEGGETKHLLAEQVAHAACELAELVVAALWLAVEHKAHAPLLQHAEEAARVAVEPAQARLVEADGVREPQLKVGQPRCFDGDLWL